MTVKEPTRKRLPDTRPAVTHKGGWKRFEFYVTVGFYDNEDDRLDPAEVFVIVAKQGSDTSVFVNGWAVMVSMALQSGVPWAKIHAKFTDSPFENLLDEVCKGIQVAIDERAATIGEDQDSEPEYATPVRLAEPNPQPADDEEGSETTAPKREDWDVEAKRPLHGKDGQSKLTIDDGTQATYGDGSVWNRDADSWTS